MPTPLSTPEDRRLLTRLLVQLGAWLAGLAITLVAVGAQAQSRGEECTDVEALANLTLTVEGRQRAADLVRQGHPVREFLCQELGWDCANDPGLAQLSAAGSGEDDPSCAGAEGFDQSRCTDPDAADAWESFAGSLLDEPRSPGAPLAWYGAACFDDSSACNPLPPPEAPPSLRTPLVPTLSTLALVFDAGSPPEGALPRPARRNSCDGLGPAHVDLDGIERPPEGRA